MAYVYILQSLLTGKYYIGSTNNLDRRLDEHRKGKTKFVKQLGKFELKLAQQYNSLELARKIEQKLKKLKSRVIVDRIIKDQKILLGP